MTITTFTADGNTRQGYLAMPTNGTGKPVLVLHAWWGLTDFFKALCDRLAAQGFVAFAPDLHQGKTAATIKEAEQIMEKRDLPAVQATAEAALEYLQAQAFTRGEKLGAIGFSMGAGYATLLDSLHPEAFRGIVLFYGEGGADLSKSKAQYQCHYAEDDDWEPLEYVKKMTAANAEIHIYPNCYHWFFEDNQPEHFNPEAAEMAWRRTLEFLGRNLAE